MDERSLWPNKTNANIHKTSKSKQKQPDKRNQTFQIGYVIPIKNKQTQGNAQLLQNNKNHKILSKDVAITLLKLNNQPFETKSTLDWSFQNSVHIQDYQLMVFNIQVEEVFGQGKTLQMRLEIPLPQIKQKILVYKYQGTIKIRFRTAYLFFKMHSTNSWKREQDGENGSVMIKFEVKGFQKLSQFLKDNLDPAKYHINRMFKTLKKSTKLQALLFYSNLKKECLKHKQAMLFDKIKIQVIQSQEELDCPVKNCDHTFPNTTQLSEHLQDSHPFLQKYGIRVIDLEDKSQLQFSEELLDYTLMISRQNPEEIAQIIQRLSI